MSKLNVKGCAIGLNNVPQKLVLCLVLRGVGGIYGLKAMQRLLTPIPKGLTIHNEMNLVYLNLVYIFITQEKYCHASKLKINLLGCLEVYFPVCLARFFV